MVGDKLERFVEFGKEIYVLLCVSKFLVGWIVRDVI